MLIDKWKLGIYNILIPKANHIYIYYILDLSFILQKRKLERQARSKKIGVHYYAQADIKGRRRRKKRARTDLGLGGHFKKDKKRKT